MVSIGCAGKFSAVRIAQIWRAIVFGGIFRASVATGKIERHPRNYHSAGHYFRLVATDDCVFAKRPGNGNFVDSDYLINDFSGWN